jgi:hypothetical protein
LDIVERLRESNPLVSVHFAMEELFWQIAKLKSGESISIGRVKITQDGNLFNEQWTVEVILDDVRQLEQVVKLISRLYDMRKMYMIGSPYTIKFKVVVANADDAYRFAKYLMELLK